MGKMLLRVALIVVLPLALAFWLWNVAMPALHRPTEVNIKVTDARGETQDIHLDCGKENCKSLPATLLKHPDGGRVTVEFTKRAP